MAYKISSWLVIAVFILLGFPVSAHAPISFSEEEYLAVSVEPSEAQIRADMVYYAMVYNRDLPYAYDLVNCESGYNLHADNPESTAYGLWQFIDGTWSSTMLAMGRSPDTPKDAYPISLEAGFFLWEREGLSHWQECVDLIAFDKSDLSTV